jgi:biopolymer transport protein ExbD
MAIKRGSKVDKSFSNAAMSDLMFLLLVFMIVATTLINQYAAVPLNLPDDDDKQQVVDDKEMPVVSIQLENNEKKFYVNGDPIVDGLEGVERVLVEKMNEREDKTFSLRCDEKVYVDDLTKMMWMARQHKFRLLLATEMQKAE